MIEGDVSASTGRTTSDEPMRRLVRKTAPSTNDPLATLADELRRLVKEVGPKPKPRFVHQIRTTIRRFETVMPELDEASPRAERRVRKQLARIRKCAGKVRDADVHLQALRSLPRSIESEAQACVRDVLQKARAKREKRLVRTLAAERERGLIKRLRQVVGQAAVARPVSDADRERTIGLVLERFDRALQAASPLGAENLHVLRLQTKRLRYLAETAAPSALATTILAQLKRVQDAVGAWHDWLTLSARAEKILAGTEAAALLAALRARTEVQLEKAVKVTTSVGRRLLALRSTATRRGTRPVTPASPVAALRSAGASA